MYFFLNLNAFIILTLPVPIPDEEKKYKAFIKLFQAPQRKVKMKI